jgi:hypothetical protein
MKLQESQSLSVSGVAVRGNPVMQDVIWPKDSPHPFGFAGGYVPILNAPSLKDNDDWEPLHPPAPRT